MSVSVQPIPLGFFVVSVVALAMHTTALARLVGGAGDTYRALLRTAISRVACGMLYVALGVYALVLEVGPETLLVFILSQLLWVTNGLLDLRANRGLSTDCLQSRVRGQGLHRKRR